jgi:hypothetical protein
MMLQTPSITPENITPELAEAMQSCPMHQLTQKMFDEADVEKAKRLKTEA